MKRGALENVAGDLKIKIEHLEKENRQFSKNYKIKEKELNKLEVKIDNLTQTISNI